MSAEEFDYVEVQRILELALEQQRRSERKALVTGGGTSLPALREIASEVGIDPRFVESAAREVARRRDTPVTKTNRMGVPDEVRADRVIPHRIDDDEWIRIVEELRTTFGVAGTVSQYGRVREWHSSASSHANASVAHLRLEEVDGGTAITLHQKTVAQTQLPLVLGATFATIGVTFAALLPVIGLTAGGLAFAGVNALSGAGIYAGGMGWASRWAGKRTELFERILDRIELLAGATEQEQGR